MTKKKRTDFIAPQRVKLQDKALEIGRDDPAPFAVYVALLLEADYRDGVAECSGRQLASWYGWNRKRVAADLHVLQDAGLIEWNPVKGSGTSTVRVIHYHELMGDADSMRRANGPPNGPPIGPDTAHHFGAPQLLTVNLGGDKTSRLVRSIDLSLSHPRNGGKGTAVRGVDGKDKQPSPKGEEAITVEVPEAQEVAK